MTSISLYFAQVIAQLMNMRSLFALILCITFTVFGTFVPAKHMLAHAEISSSVDADERGYYEEDHDHGAARAGHVDDLHGDSDCVDHHSNHGAELHFVALQPTSMTAALSVLPADDRLLFNARSPVDPLLPTDPDPDRA
nr:hypothetical protein [Hyphomonas sp. 34-62-18]